MGDFRIRYGYALGPEGTYSTRSDKTVLPESATTPDVTTGALFYTQNTTNTAITYWNVLGGGGQPGDGYHQGKRIVVFFKDGSTTVVSGAQMALLDTGGTGVVGYPAGTVAEYILHNSAWYELLRAYPTQTAANKFVTPAVTVAAGSFALDATTANVFLVTPTVAATVLVAFSGGQIGQTVTVLPQGSSQTLYLSRGGNLNIAGTGTIITSTLGAYQFIKVSNSNWTFIKGSVAN